MDKYFNDGLLPDGYIINEVFSQMLNNHRAGTLKSILEIETKNFLKANEILIFNYCYQLEGYINEYYRNNSKKDFSLKDALEYAVTDYLKTAFHDNLITFIENYAETLLYDSYGLSSDDVRHINLYDFVEYYTEDTDLEIVNIKVRKYIESLK